MAHRLTRQEVYDLAWSEPMKKLAPRFGVSDVALAKACRRADIPVPERGYWARLQAGKMVVRRPLPPRGLGMSDGVSIGEIPYETHEQLVSRMLNEPVPPPPTFCEDITRVTERVQKMVRKVAASHVSRASHPLIARLLDEDDRRREAREKSSYSLLSTAPLFDTPVAQRRLRVLNSIFLGLQRYGARPWIRDREGRQTGVEVGQQNVAFTIEPIAEHRRPARPGAKIDSKRRRERLRLSIGSPDASSPQKSWEDSAQARLEGHLTDIVVGLLVTGEANYRASRQAAHEWWLRRRAELEEEERRRREEEERRERERLAMLEKERVNRLLGEAENWRRAADLRAFVETVRLESQASASMTAEAFERWSAWVLALADRLDPIRAGRIPGDAIAGGR